MTEEAAAPGASGAAGVPVSEPVAVGAAVDTRLTGPLGLVPLIDVRGTAESVDDPADFVLDSVLDSVLLLLVPLLLATLVMPALEDSTVLEATADELDDVGSSTNVATMRISWHWSPMDSS